MGTTSPFGDELQRQRIERGLKFQKDLAAALQELGRSEYPSDALVGHWETGARRPSLAALRLLSEFFGWSLEERERMELLALEAGAAAESEPRDGAA